MRIRVVHQTKYTYGAAAKGAIQILRLTPRNHRGQHVVNWRIDLSQDCQLTPSEDAFGNIAHLFTFDRPVSSLQISVTGEVETQDTNGVVAGTNERFPPALFLRETRLTATDPAITEMARTAADSAGNDPLRILHALNATLFKTLTFDIGVTTSTTPAGEAFAQRRGVCQDFAHIFIAAARQFGMPARYVAGHLLRAEGPTLQSAGHAWTEAYVDGLGWVAFDPANGICATAAYVRIAVGLDSVGAAPIRGMVFGGRDEAMSVTISVERLRHRPRGRPPSDQ